MILRICESHSATLRGLWTNRRMDDPQFLGILCTLEAIMLWESVKEAAKREVTR